MVSVATGVDTAQAIDPAPNLAPNGSFETDPATDWTSSGSGTTTWVGEPTRTGSGAVKITATGGTTRWHTRAGRIDVTPGQTYRGIVWAQTANVSGNVSVSFNFYDSNGVRIPSAFAMSPSSLDGTTTDFSRLAVAKTAPTGADSVRIELTLTGSGSVWFDDALVVDASAAPSEPLPEPTHLGNDIIDYLSLPGNQVVVVPNGTYSVGDGSSPVYPFTDGAHEDITGEYLGWLILVAEDPHGVVIDLSDTKLRLQTPTSRILFVGFSFVNGTIEFSGMDNIAFWYTNHQYDPCVWVRKYRNELQKLTEVTDPGDLDPCGTGGGEYSDGIDDEFKKQAVRNIPGGQIPAPLRDFNVGGGAGNISFFGTDIHNAGDDAWLSFSHDVEIRGMRVWDHAEYQGPRLETIDPQVAPYPTGYTDLIHSDAIEIAFGGSFNWTMTDSWTSRSWYLGGKSSGMYFEDMWAGGAPFFQSRFLDRASDMPQPIETIRGFNIGRPSVPAHDFEGHLKNLQHIASSGSPAVLQSLECGVRSWPAHQCVSAFAPTFTFENISQALPPGIVEPTDWFDDGQIQAHLQAIRDHPDNPANIWRCDNPYDAWASFAGFDFIPSYLDVPETPGCGAPDPPPTVPNFRYQPSSVSRSAGQSATWAVIVDASPTPALQWRRDGVAIPGATGHEYRIESVDASDDGADFDVVATNSAGTTISSVATLSIEMSPQPPSVELEPSDRAVTEGDVATFSIAVAGYPSPDVQWRRDGAVIPGATSASIDVGPVTLDDDGASFDALVTNTEGSVTSSAATLTVDPLPAPPQITSQPSPADLLLNAGEVASIAIEFGGVPTPTVQWRRDGIDLSGATGTSLSIGPVSVADDGAVFDAVVTNSEGSATSSAVTLSVSNVPRILYVAGTANTPAPDQYIVSRLLTNGYMVTVVDDDVVSASDADDAELVIVSSSVVPTKVGTTFASSPTPVLTWEAYLHDDFGFVSSGSQQGESAPYAKIDIADPSHPIAAGLTGSPTVLTSASAMSRATPGGDVAVIADLAGPDPTATLFAYEKGASMAIGVAPARRVAFFPDYLGAGRLNANGNALLDAAVQWALATPTPPTFVAPTFTLQPTPSAPSLVVGGSLQLTVSVSAVPAATLQWRRDGVNIPGASGSTLAIGPVLIGDDGAVFDAIATNSQGTATSATSTLSVYAPTPVAPSFTKQPSPANLQLVDGSSGQLSVSVAGLPAPSIQWRRDGVDIPGATNSTLVVGPVTVGDNGAVFDVVATNGEGTAISSSASLTVLSAPTSNQVLFVAGNGRPPSSERSIVARLVSQGYDVSVVDDDLVVPADATGADLVIIASSIVPSKIGTLFTNLRVPIITWEPYLYAELGFVATPTQSGESSVSPRIDIVDAAHPIAAGLSGSPTVLESGSGMSRAIPGGEVAIIASLSGGSTEATVFAYDAGAAMAVGHAAARRVALMPTYSSTGSLNSNGYSVFDAAVLWALTSPSPSAPTMVSQPSPATSELVVGDTLQVSAAVDGSPAPTLQWRRNGVPIAGATTSTLTFGPVVLGDDGAVFDLVATNSEGTVTSATASVSVSEPPPGVTVAGRPTVTVSPGTASLAVTWEPIAGVSNYQLRYQPIGQLREWDSPTTGTSRLITGLVTGTTHIVEVRALEGTWGPWTRVDVAPN